MTNLELYNWAGNYRYRASQSATPSTIEDVQSIVRAAKKVRAIGTRHCFNDIADTDGTLVSTASLTKMWPVTVNAQTDVLSVKIESGVTYGMLCTFLEEQGYALPNLASLPHITVAGACATGTHGSGEQIKNLATSIAELEIVNGNGELVRFSKSRDGEKFNGAVVGLGSLGIVTGLTVEVIPTYEMSQTVLLDTPFDMAMNYFDEIQTLGYSVSLFTDWTSDTVQQIWLKQRTSVEYPQIPSWASKATSKLHPIGQMDPEPCTDQLGLPGRWFERLPHFKLEFTPSAAVELQTEYFIPRNRAIEALRAIDSIRDRISPLLQVSEIRTIAADSLWMSPAYDRESVAIHFTWYQKQPEVEALLPILEQALEPFQPRPHWGKLFTMSPNTIADRYSNMAAFVSLVEEMDPEGKFRNWYTYQNLIFG